MPNYANVIVDIALEKLDRTFQYRIPKDMEDEIRVGARVRIPFGNGSRSVDGYVLELTDKPEYEESRLKEIQEILPAEIGVEQHFLELAAWMRETYGATMVQCLKTVTPVRRKIRGKQKRYVRLNVTREQAEACLESFKKKNARAKVRLVEALLEIQESAEGEEVSLPCELVTGKLNISSSTLQALQREEVIQVTASRLYRNPAVHSDEKRRPVALRESQRQIVEQVLADYRKGQHGTYLIHGVTGSGKTEIYIEAAAEMAAMGKQVIVLIPEIALTYQTVMRFYSRFGQRVSILNSRMSAGERFDQFERAGNGELDVMIGPRSALFTPFLHLGLIIIDEEHESAYKSETMPRYHARETAIRRAEMTGASVILGSATPSLESYTKALNGEYRLFSLTERQGGGALPSVEIADLRKELAAGNRSVLSRSLYEAICDRLDRQEQIMLFLNRRGFAGFVSCRECGQVVKCPHCDVSLSYHRDGRLHCHYCGYQTPMVKTCPSCGSRYIGTFKAGTQQVEEYIKKTFPEVRVLRMDLDTTRQKGGYEAILEQFANGEADILVGTQMIVKGHDFKNVTLMGILAADMSLMVPDYRSAERTFQLLSQAAGRAGRGKRPGQVVIQTYQPEHYAVQAAAAHDYRRFYEEEMGYRMLMGYPPAAHLAAVMVSSREESTAEELAKLLKERILFLSRENPVECMGPAPAGIAKLRDMYRRVLYIKDRDFDRLTELRKGLEDYVEQQPEFPEGSVQFDMNPMQE